jgi:hypothetical protein
VKVRDIINAIQDLNPGDKHCLRAYLIASLTATSSTGIKDLIIKGNIMPNIETYNTLRTSNMVI